MRLNLSVFMLSIPFLFLGCGSEEPEKVIAVGPPPPTVKDLNPPVLASYDPTNWAFDRPALTTLRSSAKKAFAHYLPSFPRSIDNGAPATDYYQLGYLQPSGENGKHRGNGGFIRERPESRNSISASDWQVQDCATEIRIAADLGLDGFAYDILATDTTYRTRMTQMLRAAASTDTGFKILLMPDMTSEFATSPQNLKPYLKELATGTDNSALYRLADGRLVVSPFLAQAQTANWWKSTIIDPLAADGIQIALLPLFLDWKTYAPSFKDISYGMSDWGAREPVNAANMQAWKQESLPFTSIWMGTVGFSDVRPNVFSFVETEASRGCRSAWTSAISGGSNWVQLVSWNDYSESSEIQPSSGIQANAYKLNAYYLTWFKTGSAPTIVRDKLMYLHRTHPVGAAPDLSQQTRPFNRAYGTAGVNMIELVGFLKAPGTLSITVDGVTTSVDVGAGLQTITAPLRIGTPQFSLRRDGATVLQETSLWQISDQIIYQDLLYRGGDSTIPRALAQR
jgi:hypothetical protein